MGRHLQPTYGSIPAYWRAMHLWPATCAMYMVSERVRLEWFVVVVRSPRNSRLVSFLPRLLFCYGYIDVRFNVSPCVVLTLPDVFTLT